MDEKIRESTDAQGLSSPLDANYPRAKDYFIKNSENKNFKFGDQKFEIGGGGGQAPSPGTTLF